MNQKILPILFIVGFSPSLLQANNSGLMGTLQNWGNNIRSGYNNIVDAHSPFDDHPVKEWGEMVKQGIQQQIEYDQLIIAQANEAKRINNEIQRLNLSNQLHPIPGDYQEALQRTLRRDNECLNGGLYFELHDKIAESCNPTNVQRLCAAASNAKTESLYLVSDVSIAQQAMRHRGPLEFAKQKLVELETHWKRVNGANKDCDRAIATATSGQCEIKFEETYGPNSALVKDLIGNYTQENIDNHISEFSARMNLDSSAPGILRKNATYHASNREHETNLAIAYTELYNLIVQIEKQTGAAEDQVALLEGQ